MRKPRKTPELLAAKASGLTRYFTGKPCANGHVAERFVANATCCQCARKHAETAYTKFPERENARTRKWWANNKDWYAANAETLRKRARKHYRDNVERHKELSAKWNAEHPEQYQLNHKVRCHRRRARENAAEGSHTAAEIRALLIKQKHRCPYCKASLRGGYHVDHIIALARGGSNWIENIQLTCGDCNVSKAAKDPFTYAQERGMLL